MTIHPCKALSMAALIVLAGCMSARPSAEGAAPGQPNYVWNAMQAEKLQALRATGDATRGKIAFEVCQGCHRANALGRPDGSYPRLAGQHDTVLIKQMTDVRDGRRRNDKMLPFVDKHVLDTQDIADISAYLSRLPVPPDNGKGPGQNLDGVAKDYQANCANCHGRGGEGDEPQFYPRVSGQHYKYLLREMIDIRDGTRRNANPRMVEVVKGYSDARLELLADYMSRFPVDPVR